MRRIPPHRRTALGTRCWRSIAIAILTLWPFAAPTLASPVLESACSLAARRGERIIDVPFDVVDGRIYVEVQVNGSGPYRFAIGGRDGRGPVRCPLRRGAGYGGGSAD
ncbi:TPA: hypothetical protein UOA91_001737 [Stenotrophomonas maltophilia]|nr:hypothetical protein [Stenotrophomonas maltophilia]HEL3780366.1 hypothetical protein [Stenotrophomonas maltophilia]HEL5005526.1 hypothetical protein [Stenotrophomonas maltophilia]